MCLFVGDNVSEYGVACLKWSVVL